MVFRLALLSSLSAGWEDLAFHFFLSLLQGSHFATPADFVSLFKCCSSFVWSIGTEIMSRFPLTVTKSANVSKSANNSEWNPFGTRSLQSSSVTTHSVVLACHWGAENVLILLFSKCCWPWGSLEKGNCSKYVQSCICQYVDMKYGIVVKYCRTGGMSRPEDSAFC